MGLQITNYVAPLFSQTAIPAAYFRVEVISFSPGRSLSWRVHVYHKKSDSDAHLDTIAQHEYWITKSHLQWGTYFTNAKLQENGKDLHTRIYEYLKTLTGSSGGFDVINFSETTDILE